MYILVLIIIRPSVIVVQGPGLGLDQVRHFSFFREGSSQNRKFPRKNFDFVDLTEQFLNFLPKIHSP